MADVIRFPGTGDFSAAFDDSTMEAMETAAKSLARGQ